MTKKSITKKATSTKPATEKARKAAIAEIDTRLAGGRQDHEVPSPKETTNNARLAAHSGPNTAKATKPRKKPKDATHANVAAHKRPSGLDLAARILSESKEPLGAKSLAERAMAAGWNTSGRTPEATIYSAIIREIKAKGKASRFSKAGRGLFSAAAK